MLTFQRALRNDEESILLHHSIPFCDDLSERNIPPRKSSESHRLRFEVPEEYLPVVVDFETLNKTAVAPLSTRLSSDISNQKLELEVQVPKESAVTFRVLLTSNPKEKRVQSFEVEAPSPLLRDWVGSLLNRTYTNDIFAEIKDHMGTNNETQAIKNLIDSTISYLSSDQLLRLLNVSAETSVEFRENIGDIFTPAYFSSYLPGGVNSGYLNLDSGTHVRQFCASTNQFRYIPTISESDLVQEAVKLADTHAHNNSDTKLNRLWNLEENLDISNWYPSALTFPQVIGLASRAILDGRRDVAMRLFKHRFDTTQFEDLEAEITERKSDSEKPWEDLVYSASVRGGRPFEVVVANFLRETGEDKDFPVLYSVIAYEAASELFERLDNENFARTSAFYEHYYRGRLLLSNDQFDAASTEFYQALNLSLEEIQVHGNSKYTNLEGSWVYFYEAQMEQLRDRQEFDTAVETLEKGLRWADLFQDFSNKTSRKWVERRIRAILNEVKGDRALSMNEFDEAKTYYGKAIGELQSIDEELERRITYLENRRSAIKGALAEAEGEYERASNLYKSIEDRTEIENAFVKFHQTRMWLCRAQEAISRRDLSEARDHLKQISYQSTRIESERVAIEFLLDVIEKYEEGQLTEVDEAVKMLQRIDSTPDDVDAVDFGYGQDFRPAIVQILGAQRIKNTVGEATAVDDFVHVAITEGLKPNSVEELIKQREIDTTGDTDQWKQQVPDFTTRQLEEVMRKASRNRAEENYNAQAEELTNILEECTGIFVEYYARQKCGEDWKESFTRDGNVTLGDIENILKNHLSGDVSRIDEVCRLFSSTKFEDMVLPSNEGTILDVRNDLHHPNKSFVSETEYQRLKSHVESIISSISQDMPVLGKVGGQNKFGAYSIKTLLVNPIEKVEIMTNKQLKESQIYFFPPTILSYENVQVGSETILPCASEDVLESIKAHSKVTFDS